MNRTMMAGYQGMKPMLQFTNLPPPPRERRRRRRKPVRTPEVPKVKSIPLAQGGAETDDQENLPRPCLKWISPQFCDELTENGTHLKNHNPRRKKTNKTKQPLQEMKELFPSEGSTNVQQCPKSTTRRNPLRFKQNSDQCSVQGVDRIHKSCSHSKAWCSQEISMYPSTRMPCSKLRSFEDESSDDSLTDGENDRCNEGLDDRDCHICPTLLADQSMHLDAGAHLDNVDDHTVPSASQQDNSNVAGGNFADICLRLSATTQYTEVSNPTQCKHGQGENKCEQPMAHSDPTTNQNLHSSLHKISIYTPQSIHQQDKYSIHPRTLADSATEAYDNNDGHISYPSVDNLSELMRDMSVGDDVACNEQLILSTQVGNQNQSKYDHSMQVEQHECILPSDCKSTSVSGDRVISRLEVTTFDPHLASTPFRDHHSQANLSLDCDLIGSNKLETRIDITQGHREEQEMSILVRETPEHLWCSPKLDNVAENQRAKCDSERSFRMSESIYQLDGLNSLCSDSNQTEPPPQHTSLTQSNIDMTTFNNFDDTGASHTTMGESHSDSTAASMLHSTIPPTQDSTHGSEEEWSILVKQTPDELWSSPVVKVVDDSLI